MEAQAYNPSTWVAETGGDKPEVSLGPMVRVCLEKEPEKDKTKQRH